MCRRLFNFLLFITLSMYLFAGCSGEPEKSEKNKVSKNAAKKSGDKTKGEKADDKDKPNSFSEVVKKAKMDETKVKLRMVMQASRSYLLNTGVPPKSIKDFFEKPEEMQAARWRGPYLEPEGKKNIVTDAWGNEIWLEPVSSDQKEQNVVGLIAKSKGPNGKKGDEDDLSDK